MLRNIAFAVAVALAPGQLLAEGSGSHIDDVAFSFEGPFGTYDTHQLQRGLQIYTEVCAACHGLKFVSIRSLTEEGGPMLPEDQVRAYAKEFFIADELANPNLYNENKELYEVTYNSLFPANTTQNAPDLSLIAKGRTGFHGPYGLGINQLFKGIGGPEYIVALLNGYEEPPACATEDIGGYYNTVYTAGGYPDSCKIYEDREVEKTNEDGIVEIVVEKVEVGRQAPGSWIGMAPPLSDGLIEFADGHHNDVHAMSEDIAAFLMWSAEPKLNARKHAGFNAVIFLIAFSVLLYLTNKTLWAPIKRKAKNPSAE